MCYKIKVIRRSHALEDEKNNYQTHKFHRLPKICHSGVSWVEPRATLSHIKKMQRKACGAKAAYVRLLASLCVIAAARRWPQWPGAKAGFEKIGSHPDANGEHLFQKVKARKLVPPNLGLPTTEAAAARHVRQRLRRHMRRRQRCTAIALELVVDQSGSLDVSSLLLGCWSWISSFCTSSFSSSWFYKVIQKIRKILILGTYLDRPVSRLGGVIYLFYYLHVTDKSLRMWATFFF